MKKETTILHLKESKYSVTGQWKCLASTRYCIQALLMNFSLWNIFALIFQNCFASLYSYNFFLTFCTLDKYFAPFKHLGHYLSRQSRLTHVQYLFSISSEHLHFFSWGFILAIYSPGSTMILGKDKYHVCALFFSTVIRVSLKL